MITSYQLKIIQRCCHLCHFASEVPLVFSVLVFTQWSSQTRSVLLPSSNCLMQGGHLRVRPLPPPAPSRLFFTGVPCFLIGFSTYNYKTQKSNFLSFLFYYQEFSFGVKYGSRRTKGLRSLIKREAAPAVTGPLCETLNKQFLELIENGLYLSNVSFKYAYISAPVAGCY
jgi:hypothetical protein